MASLNSDRMMTRRLGADFSLPAAAGAVFYGGSLVCIGADGYAVRGSTSVALKAVGIASAKCDNSNGNAGDQLVPVERGVWRFTNLSTDRITLADYGSACYIVDDQTVARTNGGNTRSAAGTVRDIDYAGVWVEF